MEGNAAPAPAGNGVGRPNEPHPRVLIGAHSAPVHLIVGRDAHRMAQIELSDFPPKELARFFLLCAKHQVSPSKFVVYSMFPSANQPGAAWARLVYVEFLPTKLQQEYPAAVPEQDWLETFEQDLIKGYYGSFVDPTYGVLALDIPES